MVQTTIATSSNSFRVDQSTVMSTVDPLQEAIRQSTRKKAGAVDISFVVVTFERRSDLLKRQLQTLKLTNLTSKCEQLSNSFCFAFTQIKHVHWWYVYSNQFPNMFQIYFLIKINGKRYLKYPTQFRWV